MNSDTEDTGTKLKTYTPSYSLQVSHLLFGHYLSLTLNLYFIINL